MRYGKCKDCGKLFEEKPRGRRGTVCAECKRKKNAEYNRVWQRSNRSRKSTFGKCDICGVELAKEYLEGGEKIWLCPNHKLEVTSGRRRIGIMKKKIEMRDCKFCGEPFAAWSTSHTKICDKTDCKKKFKEEKKKLSQTSNL